MAAIEKIYPLLRNKYFISLAVFLIWMSFFDPKDWGLIYNRNQKLKELQKSEKTLNQQITQTKNELSFLKTSAQTIERYAREKYLMKKDNEDIFLVKNPENQPK